MPKKLKNKGNTQLSSGSAVVQQTAPDKKKEIEIRFGPDFKACQEKYKKSGTWDRISKQLEKFLRHKLESPTVQFGSNDKPGKHVFRGYFKAHLTHDDSVVYKYSGSENVLRLYGIWSHDELGTGQPPSVQRSHVVANKLDSQVFEKRNLTR